MLNEAGVLGLLAAASACWPGSVSVVRLERALTSTAADIPRPEVLANGQRAIARLPRSRTLRTLLACGALVLLSQLMPVPVAMTFAALAVTGVLAWMRGTRSRAVFAEEQAALEGLGIVVAELRAGRAPEDALNTAGRHCGHPAVEALLSWLSRSVRMGGLGRSISLPETGASTQGMWRARLIAGVRLSHETGCALADVMAAVESDLAAFAQRRADFRAAAAGHRATVALLSGLPILGLAMGSGIGANPLRILTTTSIGNVLLLGGVALELLGLAWSRRLSDRALGGG